MVTHCSSSVCDTEFDASLIAVTSRATPTTNDETLSLASRGGRFNGEGVAAHAGARLREWLTVLEGPTDIDESNHRDWLAIKNPCRATADANAEVSF